MLRPPPGSHVGEVTDSRLVHGAVNTRSWIGVKDRVAHWLELHAAQAVPEPLGDGRLGIIQSVLAEPDRLQELAVDVRYTRLNIQCTIYRSQQTILPK